jgi:ribosomal protein L11 methylase PrmA
MAEEIADHIGWLADANRMRALRSAIDATVKPGDVVIDVGTGTGVLALMACAAGARRVYAIERGPIIELARKIVAANGCRDRVWHSLPLVRAALTCRRWESTRATPCITCFQRRMPC